VSKSGAIATALKFFITAGLCLEVVKYLGVFVFSCPLPEIKIVKKLNSNSLFNVIIKICDFWQGLS
jgi:hypothetical protein